MELGAKDAHTQFTSHALALTHALVDRAEDVDSVPYHRATPQNIEETTSMVEDLGVRCMTRTVDVRNGFAMSGAVADVIASLESGDSLLVNAGIFSLSSVEQMSDETWRGP